ncbi:MAG: thiamine pyrophosphate-dependent dehydrogenase E1 component subunit alpha, partial [Chloroflexi bacterium]|nr:thiamine pyrophosphate-dependent dehydrogenase E1 component subunit alpha [Chloroflexota bacterium]
MALYRVMSTIRHFEETVAELYQLGQIPGSVHLYTGEEACAAGVGAALQESDYLVSTHRGHGHLIAKGADVRQMMAEILGRRTGSCGGRGGSLHIADFRVGIIGAMGIVGGGLPVATGAALASKMQRDGRVVVCFFGDGASNQGTFHESLNLAALWSLPVIYVCENNQ